MPEPFVDFRIIKEQISVVALLKHYNVQLRKVNSQSLRGRCPLPTHSSKTSTESFSVRTDKNVWACQSDSCASTRQGKRGGNILDFVSIMERCSIRDAGQKLHDWFLSSSSKTTGQGSGTVPEKLVSKKAIEPPEGEPNKPLSFTLKDLDYVHSSELQKLHGDDGP